MIAFVALPIGIPLAVRAFEPDRRRRWLMDAFVAIGVVVGLYLFIEILRGPIEARIASHHLAYSAPMSHGGLVVSLYIVAVCGALLLSSYRHVVIFGIANLIAVAILARLTIDGFASLWCAYAAVASGAIAAHMRWGRTTHERARIPTTV
jgi:hypothetical protein